MDNIMMKCSVRSMNEWLYPDTEPSDEKMTAELRTVRGGSTGFCVLLSGIPAGTTVSAALTSGGGAFSAELFCLLPVHVERNTGEHGFTADWETARAYSTREAPFDVFDAAEPLTPAGFTAGGRNEALYVSFRFLPEALSGEYGFVLTVTAGDEVSRIDVKVSVADVLLPSESLKITNWFSVRNMAQAHGYAMWSEDHWRMIEKYGRQMRRMRQNVFWVTGDTVHPEKNDDGTYSFDFSDCERLIRTYLGMGFRVIEGAPLFVRDSWGAKEFKIDTPDGRVAALSDEGQAFTAEFLTAWRNFLEKNGWYHLLIQHIGDEPHAGVASEYRVLSGIVRKFLPGVPLIDAVETHELDGALDIWVPMNGPDNRLPAGDTHILYPLGGEVLGSMRAEMARCGAEDYELLRLLSKKDSAAAESLCRTVFRAFDDCDDTAEEFGAVHDSLIDALLK